MHGNPWVSRHQKGKTSLDLNEARDDGVSGWISRTLIIQTICTSLQTDNHTNTSSLNFCRPDALPGGPTNSVKVLTDWCHGRIIQSYSPVGANVHHI